MIWTVWTRSKYSGLSGNGKFNIPDRNPIELTKAGAPAPTYLSEQSIGHEGNPIGGRRAIPLYAAYRFDADTEDEARRIFNHMRQHGIPANPLAGLNPPGEPKRVWRHRGAPHYLAVHGRNMLMTDAYIKGAWDCGQLRRLNSTIAGLNEGYHQARIRKAGLIDSFSDAEKTAASQSISAAERVVEQFVCRAASAASMVDDAANAFGVEPPVRSFAVMSTSEHAATIAMAEDREATAQETIRLLSEEIAALKAAIAKSPPDTSTTSQSTDSTPGRPGQHQNKHTQKAK